MKYILMLFLLILFTSCHSTAKYRSIKNSRKAQSSKNYKYSGNLSSAINPWLGTPYKYGGMSKRGVDCSGFVSIVYMDVYNLQLPRTSRDQYISGKKIRINQIHKGDLVFFRGVRGSGIDHVGIYLEDGKFVHASVSNGVIISNLCYLSRFLI